MPAKAREMMDDPGNEVLFSASSIWEVAIKKALGRVDFTVDPEALRLGLLTNRFIELPVTAVHGAAVARLPLLHRDPFDRILVAQAMIEGVTLLTVDPVVAGYPGDIRLV
jgi:PIN domain nuclease of toxin-antitoxin system